MHHINNLDVIIVPLCHCIQFMLTTYILYTFKIDLLETTPLIYVAVYRETFYTFTSNICLDVAIERKL